MGWVSKYLRSFVTPPPPPLPSPIERLSKWRDSKPTLFRFSSNAIREIQWDRVLLTYPRLAESSQSGKWNTSRDILTASSLRSKPSHCAPFDKSQIQLGLDWYGLGVRNPQTRGQESVECSIQRTLFPPNAEGRIRAGMEWNDCSPRPVSSAPERQVQARSCLGSCRPALSPSSLSLLSLHLSLCSLPPSWQEIPGLAKVETQASMLSWTSFV